MSNDPTCAFCGKPITEGQPREHVRAIPPRDYHKDCWEDWWNTPGKQAPGQ